MKKKGVTRIQWRVREAKLNWKKNRARRVVRWKVALLCFNSIAIVFSIVFFVKFPERGKRVSVSVTIDEPVVAIEEVQAEEMVSEIEEIETQGNPISNSGTVIIGEVIQTEPITEPVPIEETQVGTEIETETETESESSQVEATEDVEETIVEELIAEHTIDNPNSSANRNTNMAVAAQIINEATGGQDGYLLEPGEKFSWLEVVGKTTEEKGFKKAPEYQNGKLVQGIGGGICQVSTTINSTIQKTEQKTGEEYFHAEPHSITLKTGKPPAYIKPERGDKEASVASSVGKDFWFINSLAHSIRIRIETNGGAVTVQIFKREFIPN